MSADQYKGLTQQDLKNLNKTERLNQIKRIESKFGGKGEGYSHEYTLEEGVSKPFSQPEIVKSKTHKRYFSENIPLKIMHNIDLIAEDQSSQAMLQQI